MAAFRSPRFQGNAVLQDILDDPDTGTRKLQKHSDETAVALVQEAVYDLLWALSPTGSGAYPSRSAFVDGDYGPTTERAVLEYKRHYRIVFPPGDPGGFVDGFTGPRTLQKLDGHIAWRDLVRDVIDARVTAMQAAGEPVALAPIGSEPPPLQPWRGSGGYLTWEATWGGQPALLVGTRPDIAFALRGGILARWLELDGCKGAFGPPTSDVRPDGSGGFVCTFDGGELAEDANRAISERPGPVAYAVTTPDEAWV